MAAYNDLMPAVGASADYTSAGGASGGGTLSKEALIEMNWKAVGIAGASGGGGGTTLGTMPGAAESQAARDARTVLVQQARIKAEAALKEQAFRDHLNKLFAVPYWSAHSGTNPEKAVELAKTPALPKQAEPSGKDHAASLAAAVSKAKQKNFGFGQSHITFDRLIQIAVEEYLKQRGLGW